MGVSFIACLSWSMVSMPCDDHDDEEVESIGQQSSTMLLHVCSDLVSASVDLWRDVQKTRLESLTGVNHQEITAKLNSFIASRPHVGKVAPCSEFNMSEVTMIAQKLTPYVDSSMQTSLPENDGRRVVRSGFGDFRCLKRGDAHCQDIICVEILKAWAHHVPNSMKESLPIDLPLLPEFDTSSLNFDSEDYAQAMTHVSGHSSLLGRSVRSSLD